MGEAGTNILVFEFILVEYCNILVYELIYLQIERVLG